MFNFSLNWAEYKQAFAEDGSWRDIYISETTVQDWNALLDFINEGHYPAQYKEGRDKRAVPRKAFDVLRRNQNLPAALLTVDAGGVTLHCHFFDQNEIEFDFDPREVKEERHAHAIFEFMSQIGAELNKDVFLTEEDAAEDAWFIYDVKTGEIIFQELERE